MKTLNRLVLAAIFIFLYAPMAVMVFFSFNASKSTFVFTGFSFRWYKELFSASQTVQALRNTLVLALLSAVIATVLGVIAAVGIFRMRSKAAKSTIKTVTNIPMMNPDIVTGVSLMLLFVFVGKLLQLNNSLSFYTLLIAHVTFNLPYVILNVLPKLAQSGKGLIEAAQDLGCTYSKAFIKVVMPNITSGIVSGFIMAFTLSIDDFVISYFTNGTGFQTLPLLIYSKTKKTVKPDLYALSSCIFIIVLLLLVLTNVLQARTEKKKEKKIKKTVSTHSRVFRNVFVTCCIVLCVAVGVYGLNVSLSEGKVTGEGENKAPYQKSEQYKELFDSLQGEYTTKLAGTTLNVFNWGEYISDGSEDSLDVIDSFEKLTGITVNYDYFESNETMYSKLRSGAVSYDVAIPSDYMIERMVNEDMLSRLDFTQLSNFKNIAPEYENLYYDSGNLYSVPYSVGMVGIIYDKTKVEKVDSWDVMWDEKYKDQILTFNNSRDAFMIAQMKLGQDINSANKADWDLAADELIKQNSVIQARVMDEVFNKMGGGNALIAPYYAGDYYTMLEVNENLAFAYPKEGTNIFVDAMVVPSSVRNYDAAMMFINYMLEPEVALANAEYICYASPNSAVINNDNYSFKGDEILYPKKEDMPPVQYYHDMDPKVRSYYEKLWEKVLRS